MTDVDFPNRMEVATKVDDGVGVIRLDSPETRNSLSNAVLGDLSAALSKLDAAPDVRAVIIAGRDDVFASGANLLDLAAVGAIEHYFGDRARHWDVIRRIRTPTIAAVAGLCLGGGCELAMICDIVVAAESARFGFPETRLGLIPGAGGTQRLTRALGKAKAMEVVLAGRLLTAGEAEASGLIARVADDHAWFDEALRIARELAARSAVALRLAKEAIDASFETGLEAGLALERKAFAIAFSSEEAREGIGAFLAERAGRSRRT
jgi:enoyl-CoA hydratase